MTTKPNENPGCLGAIFKLFKGEHQSKLQTESTQEGMDERIEALPYRLRDDFLSPSEFSFYRVLTSIIGADKSIQSKVRLADIFFVARPNENARYFNKISAKHVDFLVCDPVTMKPLLGIELDDSSHQQAERIERDEFVDKVFQAANLPLLHVPNQRSYNTREIEAFLAPHLVLAKPPAEPQSAPLNAAPMPVAPIKPAQVSPAPVCPKCGIPMVLRTVSQGEHKGKQFYGCANFPRCREVKMYTP